MSPRSDRLRARRRASGLCQGCGKPSGGRYRCSPCSERINARRRRPAKTISHRKEAGPIPLRWTDGDLEICELAIRVGIANKRRTSAESRISDGLKWLKGEGFEIEIRIRGDWRERHGRHRLLHFEDEPWINWRHGKRGGYVELATGPLVPSPRSSAPSEIVLHGTKARSLHQHGDVGRVALVHLEDV